MRLNSHCEKSHLKRKNGLKETVSFCFTDGANVPSKSAVVKLVLYSDALMMSFVLFLHSQRAPWTEPTAALHTFCISPVLQIMLLSSPLTLNSQQLTCSIIIYVHAQHGHKDCFVRSQHNECFKLLLGQYYCTPFFRQSEE